MALATKASAANHVVDYIPLVEILDVRAEIYRCIRQCAREKERGEGEGGSE